MIPLIEIDAYRIRTDRWKRGWQAEWSQDPAVPASQCMWCPRAWTRCGVLRKAHRWYRNGTDFGRHRRRYSAVAAASQENPS